MHVARQSYQNLSLNGRLMATSSGCSMQVNHPSIMAISVFDFLIDLRTSSAECALNESNTSTLLLFDSLIGNVRTDVSNYNCCSHLVLWNSSICKF